MKVVALNLLSCLARLPFLQMASFLCLTLFDMFHWSRRNILSDRMPVWSEMLCPLLTGCNRRNDSLTDRRGAWAQLFSAINVALPRGKFPKSIEPGAPVGEHNVLVDRSIRMACLLEAHVCACDFRFQTAQPPTSTNRSLVRFYLSPSVAPIPWDIFSLFCFFNKGLGVRLTFSFWQELFGRIFLLF